MDRKIVEPPPTVPDRPSVVMPGWVLSYLDHPPKRRTHSTAHNLRKFSEFVL